MQTNRDVFQWGWQRNEYGTLEKWYFINNKSLLFMYIFKIKSYYKNNFIFNNHILSHIQVEYVKNIIL